MHYVNNWKHTWGSWQVDLGGRVLAGGVFSLVHGLAKAMFHEGTPQWPVYRRHAGRQAGVYSTRA